MRALNSVPTHARRYTVQCDGVGVLNCLEAIRQVMFSISTRQCFFFTCFQAGIQSTVRFYQASTSELYGKIQVTA
jgi:GDP-D-mannose dehydratase